MKKKLFLFLFLLSAIGLNAQTAKEEIFADVHRSASMYYAYPDSRETELTPASSGYAPFYISTYQRHGSRFLTNPHDYAGTLAILRQADAAGKLTPLGKKTMTDVDSLTRMSQGRIGELSPLGAKQLSGIGQRMVHNFPEVFTGNARVDARSTIVIRCILSMMNECLQFKAFNPVIDIRSDASEHDMYYMNYDDEEIAQLRELPEIKAVLEKFRREHTHPERLMASLFNDRDYVKQHIDSDRLMRTLFSLAGNMQSHKGQTSIHLYPLFTKEECYDLWQIQNLEWYNHFGSSPLTKGQMPYIEANLLDNILNTADTCITRQRNGATVRFGHDTCVMPLAALMELGDCSKIVHDPDSLADACRNYKIVMMASNIQLIFYRSSKDKDKDILVKALLNEQEVSLPVKTDLAPYYHWKDVEAYYRNKLLKFRNQRQLRG
ncbi:MAG TPA: histidine acid phosphatase [Porphyromonadaceae bacterium]|jgi:hypothetical protein|nr:histidine acid phosphatase [Porphyromonadaceae bacterium]HBL34438.1 histidine acid phosphatase [Porphyromonadaceae bacterium]